MSTPLRRTPATLAVLAWLLECDEPAWGLHIVKHTGLTTGTVYPMLERFEHAGMLRSGWDPAPSRGARRRLYELTDEGHRWARQMCAEKGSLRGAHLDPAGGVA